MNPLQHYLEDFINMIRWTPAHPEKRNSMPAYWSRDDCLNHVADEVAIGNVDFDIDCKYGLIELQAEEIMKDLLIPNSWSVQM